ncbi:hypothetical protein [Pseudonocardia sp.]|uniref:hypothetical protein n=1 Tax=Pseudonocardia sp. TaxID=60912 RepID=UPI003D0A4DD7
MMSTLDRSAPPTLTGGRAAAFRRAGRWLLASAAAGLAALATVITVEVTSGTAEAAQRAADRLGVGVDELPADVVSDVYGHPTWAEELLLSVPLALVGVLFVVAVRAAVRPAGGGPLATAATVLAGGCAAFWIGTIGLSGLVNVEALAVQHWIGPLVVLTVATGGAALAALAVLLRRCGVARRSATTVGVLGVLSVIGCFALPPVAPILFGAVAGVGLVRTRGGG